MMKSVILFITIFTCHQSVFAQGTTGGSTTNFPIESPVAIGALSMDDFSTYTLNYNDVNGSPYIENDFIKGYIVLIDKSKTEELSMQYDIYSNEFFYLHEEGSELVIDQKYIREIVMTGEEEMYHFKRINPVYPLKLYDIIFESAALYIYAELDLNFYEGKDDGINKTDPRFSRTDKYFVLHKGDSPKRIKLKKKDVFKYFSQADQQRMTDIAKEQSLKLKSSSDFKKLFAGLRSE